MMVGADETTKLWRPPNFGTVGSVLSSDIRDLRFESSHWQFLNTVNSIEKIKTKKKRPETAQFFKYLRLLLTSTCFVSIS